METALNISSIIIAFVFSWCITSGLFEWARARREERKLFQEKLKEAEERRKFWQESNSEKIYNIGGVVKKRVR